MNKPSKSKRDLTKDQFEYQARKLGFTPEGFWGYWKYSKSNTSHSVMNAGNRRRDQISYLRKMAKRDDAKLAAKQLQQDAETLRALQFALRPLQLMHRTVFPSLLQSSEDERREHENDLRYESLMDESEYGPRCNLPDDEGWRNV